MKLRIYLTVLISSLMSVSIVGCSCSNKNKKPTLNKDISIIYTTDVHCGIDDNLGYSSLYNYKENLKKTNYVTLIDSGDYLQGDFIGAISNGSYIIDIMNEVGYDIVTLGNHEFDYGMDELSSRLNDFNGDIVSCNVSYTGEHENKLDMVKPYVIKQYDDIKIGYVGVTTPTTIVEADPLIFMEDEEIVYDFHAPSPEAFYSYVQDNIDECKSDGADYIILLSHLGSLSNYSPYSSIDVISHTSGVLAFLDGHAHVNLPWTTYKNKDNVDTLLVDTGYKLNDFASLTISRDGQISYEFINEYEHKSEKIDNYIATIKQAADELGNRVVANIDLTLKITNEDGIRFIRNGEMPIGNLVSDSYRIIADADIGFANGGGIRENLNEGDVTYKDIKNVHPFGNSLVKKKVTGSQILDYLEFCSIHTEKERVKNNMPNGEDGSFAHPSGLRYTIDTSIPSSVVIENEEFVRVDGPRRVKNVQVLEGNNYVDIIPDKEYSLASHNFLLISGGGGANMFKDDIELPCPQLLDYEVLIKYISEVLEGHLKDKYSDVEGRITVI